MGDLKGFKKEILLTTLGMAAFAEVLSLIAYRPSLWFTAGLAAGTAATIVSFLLMAGTGVLAGKLLSSGTIVIGFFAGMLLYGVVFFVCIRASVPCGFGALAGFLSLHMGIFVLYGIIYRIRGKKNPLNDWTEPKEWNDLSSYDEKKEKEEDDWDRGSWDNDSWDRDGWAEGDPKDKD